MLSKSKILKWFLYLSLTIVWIPCSGQDSAKYCLTPDQRRFVLIQAYELQECDSVQKSLKRELIDYKSIVINDGILLENKQMQLDLSDRKIETYLADNQFIKSELHIKNKKVRLLKTGLYIVGGFSVLEMGWIAFHR